MQKSLIRWLTGMTLAVPTLVFAADGDDLFKQLDKNNDGQITKDEIDADKPRLFERLVRSGDKNGDGKLSREEFEAATKDRPAPPANPVPGAPGGADGRPMPREIFQRFDKNGDGKLSKDEAPERMQQNWERLDRNGDGFVTIEELTQGLQALGKPEGKKPDGKPEAGKPAEPDRKPDSKPDRPATTVRPGVGGLPAFLAVLDVNGDGELSADEIAGASKALASLDKNGDGKLTRDELFPNASTNLRPGDGNLREMLGRLRESDKNGDGKISREEAPERLRQVFDRIDANSDGQLDETEIRQVLERFRDRQPKP